jgi:hypothetical protein
LEFEEKAFQKEPEFRGQLHALFFGPNVNAFAQVHIEHGERVVSSSSRTRRKVLLDQVNRGASGPSSTYRIRRSLELCLLHARESLLLGCDHPTDEVLHNASVVGERADTEAFRLAGIL